MVDRLSSSHSENLVGPLGVSGNELFNGRFHLVWIVQYSPKLVGGHEAVDWMP